ncbi:MAG: phage tail protein [Planctomycetaceae bacterium]|jgi:predicted secreted protein|nr:phage tail protein [Planctomycetaceae bacterium]
MPGVTFNLGINAKLFLNTSEMKNVTDVTITLDAGEVDVTTRDNDGFRATIGGLKECTIEFDMLDKNDDNSFDTIQSAWYNATSVTLKALSSANGSGPHGDFSITGFSRSEALEEAVKYSVTAKLTKWTAWISGSST